MNLHRRLPASSRCPTALRAGAAIAAAVVSAPAHAQSPSIIQTKAPNALLLLDTSGSMASAIDGSSLANTTCTAANKKTRWMVLAEVLTGTIGGHQCGMVSPTSGPGTPAAGTARRWVPLASNTCVPAVNEHPPLINALASDPKAWPTRMGPAHRQDPVLFVDNYDCRDSSCNRVGNMGGDTCEFGSGLGRWEQSDDGLIDVFGNQIRFGLMTFDGITQEATAGNKCAGLGRATTSWVHEAGAYGSGYSAGFGPRYPGWEGSHWNRPPPGNYSLQLWRQAYTGTAWRPVVNPQTYLEQQNVSPRLSTVDPFWTHFTNTYFPTDFSYWYDSPAEHWRNGARAAATIGMADVSCRWLRGTSTDPTTTAARCTGDTQCRTDNPTVCVPLSSCTCPASSITVRRADGSQTSGRFCQKTAPSLDTDDFGARNPEAPPWMGRLIGFHPTLEETVAQRQDHNRMVELATLASGPYVGSTPLAAMMRDAKQFILDDVETEGVYLRNGPTNVKISPAADPDFATDPRCRETHIVLVTDGEPYNDLRVRASLYSKQLADEGVRTYVVGVGLSTVRFGGSDIPCADLRASDLAPGQVCGPHTDDLDFAAALVGGLTNSQRSAIRACCTMLDIAVQGGSEQAYFPSNQAELRGQFSNILSNIAGGSISRTIPIFAPAVPATIVGPDANVFFELRSSLEVPNSGGPWRGHLERVRYQCDPATFAATRQDIAAAQGDVLEATLPDETDTPRRFFTVVPNDADDFDRTLRPLAKPSWCDGCGTNPTTLDGLSAAIFTRLGGNLENDALQTLNTFPTAIQAATPLADVLGLENGHRADCDDVLHPQAGLVDLATCARRVVKWWSGHPDPCEGPDCPTTARFDGGAAMGAIYRSNPVVVSPPQPDSADQSYSNQRFDGSDESSYATSRHARRPTMLYAQSVDGFLHAFALARNSNVPTESYFTQVPTSLDGRNSELWAFAPPIVMRSIWPAFNSHARLLDGPIATADVVYHRSIDDLGSGLSQWSTVLVGSGGFAQVTGATGGYYYALDITDPTAPRFLWQITKAGNADLFAPNAAGAAITHLVVDKAGEPEVVAVAILPGGSPSGAAPDAVKNRQQLPPVSGDYRPRTRIRDWGTAQQGRSLTVVELASGRVIARLHGFDDDTPTSGPNGLNPSVVHRVPFDSPITGSPSVFPATTGDPARQIYVGDMDGTLWRVDVRNRNPALWTASVAWDAYNRDGTDNALKDAWVGHGPSYGALLGSELSPAPSPNDAALLGQPIQQAPLVSIDSEGQTVVMFATGDQETFMTEAPSMVNFVVSFTDVLDGVSFAPTVNGPSGGADPNRGLHVAFLRGARVTGPLTLYDGQLMFSFFDPSEATNCALGSGGMCAMDFLRRADPGTQRPIPFINLDGDGDVDNDDICRTTPGRFVFGMSVQRIPSCSSGSTGVVDPWLGGSYTTSTTSVSPGFELVMQTGEGGSSDEGGVTNVARVTLPMPRRRTQVSSWVSAIE